MGKQECQVTMNGQVVYKGRRANYNEPHKAAVFIDEAIVPDGKQQEGRILIFDIASPFTKVEDI
jgi:hypothetical protein